MTENGFERTAADGIIDVQAVDVKASSGDTSDEEVPFVETTVIDVDVQQLPEPDA